MNSLALEKERKTTICNLWFRQGVLVIDTLGSFAWENLRQVK